MARHNYAFQGYKDEHMARAVLRDAGISTKHAIEICNSLRKQPLGKAKQFLQDVIVHKRAVPFTRFTNGAGHKRGRMAAGQYPEKASKAILSLLETVEKNAEQKDMDTESLVIHHMAAQKASRPVRFSRHRGREAKRSHVEIVVLEGEKTAKKKDAPKKSDSKKEAPKAEPKKEVKKEQPKTEKKEESPKAEQKKDGKEVPKQEAKEAQSAKASKEEPKEEKKEAPKESKSDTQ